MTRRRLTFRPQTATPNSNVGVKLRKSRSGTTTVIGIETPGACESIFAGYSWSGDVDSAPGQGPNVVFFDCGAGHSDVRIVAAGIFCPSDVFEWRGVVHTGGAVTLDSTVDGHVDSDDGGPPALNFSTVLCTDPTHFFTAQLYKNGVAWGPIATAKTLVVSGDCFATFDNLNDTIETTTDVDVNVTMALEAAFAGTVPADVTFSFDAVFPGDGGGYTPDVVANGPSIADGFTIQWRPGDSPNGTLAGSQYQIHASINGGANGECASYFASADTYAVEWLSSPADLASPLQFPFLGSVPGQYGTYINVSGPGSLTLYARGNATSGKASSWTVIDGGSMSGDFSSSTSSTIEAGDTLTVSWGGTPGTIQVNAVRVSTGELAPPASSGASGLQIIVS